MSLSLSLSLTFLCFGKTLNKDKIFSPQAAEELGVNAEPKKPKKQNVLRKFYEKVKTNTFCWS